MTMTTNDKTTDTGTPDVEALIRRLQKLQKTIWTEWSDPDSPNYDAEAIPDALTTLRTLTARIAELEGQVEQARREGMAHVIDAVERIAKETPLIMASAISIRVADLALDPIPSLAAIKAAAEAAGRAKCVAELRAESVRLGKVADGFAMTGEHDAALMARRKAVSAADAADHLEANGREQTDG